MGYQFPKSDNKKEGCIINTSFFLSYTFRKIRWLSAWDNNIRVPFKVLNLC